MTRRLACSPDPTEEPRGIERRAFLTALGAGAASLALSACQGSGSAAPTPPRAGGSASTLATGGSAAAASQFPVTVTHAFGQTTIPEVPRRIVALGQTDCDPLLALGNVPIAVGSFMQSWYSPVNPWNKDALGAKPAEVNFSEIQFEKILALKPDLITMVSGGITESQYNTLSKICPVVGRPVGYEDSAVPYGPATLLIGQAVGKSAAAKKLVDKVDAQFAAARALHPEWNGLHAVHAECYTNQFDVLGENAPRTRFLTSLGFKLPGTLNRQIGSAYSMNLSTEKLDLVGDADLVVWNSDPGTTKKVQQNPAVANLAAVKKGNCVWVSYASDCYLMWSMDWGTVLSAPYAIKVGVPYIEQALAGKSPIAAGGS
jgi:iron complex transport system substrate-binding protein